MTVEKVVETIVITDPKVGDGWTHIPYPSSVDGGGFQTLCGWCDTNHEVFHYKEKPANCLQCIDVLNAVKAMRFPRGYSKKEQKP